MMAISLLEAVEVAVLEYLARNAVALLPRRKGRSPKLPSTEAERRS